MADDTQKKEKLLLEVSKILTQYSNTNNIGVRSYLCNAPSNMSVQSTKYLAQWICGFNCIRKNSPIFDPGDIWTFISSNKPHQIN